MSNIAIVRDIAIIALALESLVIGVLLILLMLQIRSLAKLLQEDLEPILDSTKETVSTVRGTTVFLSDHVVTPLIRIASLASGANKVLRVLTRRRRKGGH